MVVGLIVGWKLFPSMSLGVFIGLVSLMLDNMTLRDEQRIFQDYSLHHDLAQLK
jgi:hypothetical protein